MSSYESHIFLLCLLVFVSLTVIFTVMTAVMASLSIKLIRNGCEDEKIQQNYRKGLYTKKKRSCFQAWVTGIISVAVIMLFGFSIYMHTVENDVTKNIPVFRVVKSDSMSKRYSENTYLYEHNLTDQFSTFDLILTRKMPREEELQLYDVIVYEIDDVLVVHRIVGIEEPNEKHPSNRYFLVQGDAVEYPDRFPVLYEQMKGIYRGEKIPFVGSFICFLQSPAGYMCIALVIFVDIALPILERKIDKETQKRLAIILSIKQQNQTPHIQINPPIICPPIVLYPVEPFSEFSNENKEQKDETHLA